MATHRLSNDNEQNAFVTLESIEVPDQLREQITTGVAEFDLAFAGEGIRPSSVVLWAGKPGMGKTTACLKLAGQLAEQGHVCLYNSCEESREQIKMNVERFNIAGIGKTYISNISEVETLIDYCNRLMKAKMLGPKQRFFLFVDSLKTIETKQPEGKRGRPPSQLTQGVEAVWQLAYWAKDIQALQEKRKPSKFKQVFVIGQVCKDGKLAGKEEVVHAVDCFYNMETDTDRKSPMYGERYLSAEKNRFGLTMVPFYYKLRKNGLEFTETTLPSDEE